MIIRFSLARRHDYTTHMHLITQPANTKPKLPEKLVGHHPGRVRSKSLIS